MSADPIRPRPAAVATLGDELFDTTARAHDLRAAAADHFARLPGGGSWELLGELVEGQAEAVGVLQDIAGIDLTWAAHLWSVLVAAGVIIVSNRCWYLHCVENPDLWHELCEEATPF